MDTDKKFMPVIIVLFVAIIGLSGVILFKDQLFKGKDTDGNKASVTSTNPTKSDLKITVNSLTDFDLAFLKLENEAVNKVYSPLSIKYALEMLSEGADGDTKNQIDAIIGDYVARKYENSSNMSFANALFVRDSFKDSVNSDYVDLLQNTYNAELIYDSFATPKTINDWISKKTFKIIPEMISEPVDSDYVLVNALAIDMEWKNKIQDVHNDYSVEFKHLEADVGKDYPYYGVYVGSLDSSGYSPLDFEGTTYKTKAVEITSVANRFDAIEEYGGEEAIRDTVQKEYDKWKKSASAEEREWDDFKMDTYISELKSNYKHISSSTDFSFYNDDEVKVFSKDLKTYGGVTLQYIGIMPKKQSLADYVKNSNASSINTIITKIKNVSDLDAFEDGYLTIIEGEIPLFNYEYDLDLMADLKAIGITDVFDSGKANLSKISDTSSYIDTALHTANIEFSNEGIKAAAATVFGGKGAAGGGFEYRFEAPVKYIDLTFNKPFMYIIRDKDTGEVWFTGTVYRPREQKDSDYDYAY